jgi:hypothetical protein
MKIYLVMVEGLVKRYISVEADNKFQAENLAAEEFCALLGAEPYYVNQSEAVDENHEILM